MRRGGCAFLDPEEIVLCGEMLNGTHLAQVRRQCAAMLVGPLPQFALAKDFLEDYTAGVAGRALGSAVIRGELLWQHCFLQ